MRHLILFVFVFFSLNKLSAQTSHPTIVHVQAGYKIAQTSTVNPAMSVPEATVVLNSQANISRLYFTVIDPADTSVVHSANYSISTSPVLSGGKKVFEKFGEMVFVSAGQEYLQKAYRFEFLTSDSLQNMSPKISINP